ncbi:MAG: ABC transporter ATP-binding protein/permease, partial [Chloroflexi bacterium]|nr:ABC transporter ATP-binding protein/permease [Chloroflexota bacterium]
RRGPVRWIASHAIYYWYLAVVMVVGAVGNAALASVVPIYIGKALNIISAEQPEVQALVRISFIIAISQVVRSVLQLGRNFGAELIGQRIERDIRDELYVSLLGKSMTFHSLQPVGDTMARATNDVREINLMFSPGINLVIGSANFIIMPLVLGPRYHPALILAPLIYTILYFLSLWQYLHELRPITDNVRSAFGQLNTRLAEAIDGIETVKGMAQELREVDLFGRNAHRFLDLFVRQSDVEARFIPFILMALAQAGGLLHAILLYRQGLLDIGDIAAYFGLLLLLGFPTFVSLFAYSLVSLGVSGARRVLELINRETDLDQNAGGFSGTMQGAVEFRDVSFAYGEAEPSLAAITLQVRPGQTVAIVGQTGTGKTSLVKLVNRTYDVTNGQVLVDGIDVRDWNLESLRRQISIIEQDIFLFSRSIAENIAFGKPGATQDEIEAAARSAQAHEFITAFKDGYQTVIGERGATLSGGQRQRLALARAFLTDPKILVLDDSTSAIDSDTEDKIQRAIYAAAEGRTTLIITHRLSQIRWADQIVVLRGGRITAIGSHDELMATSEAYRRIFSE